MKTIVKNFVWISVAAILAVFSSCSKENMASDSQQYASILQVASDGSTAVIEPNLQAVMVETSALTETELEMLLKMKEEEKLARDVYYTLYEKWGSQIFSNISGAEEKHLDAVVLLLKTYGASDTLISDRGIFASAEVTALYNELISKGSVSLEEALKVSVLIEEMDIKDLAECLENTSNQNIIIVFENLLKGSRNHLRAFNRQLNSLGISYAPVYIDQATYDQIVNSPMEQGKQYKMQGKGNKGNGNCNGSAQGKRYGKN
jgi:hypothetical protein